MRTVVLVVCLLGLTLGIASAQTFGEIGGEVRDPSGALIPNATVTVINTATSASRVATTNAAGFYSFPDLVPGTYDVKVASSGFDTIVKAGIVLEVQAAPRVDFTLAVGQSTQTVEVAANAAALATEDATVGTVIEEKRIEDLPLNGRSFFQLVALSPNVTYGFTQPAQTSGRLGGSRGSLTMAMSGARSTWENYTLDGITNTDIDFNSYILQPSVDALQEFKVQSGVYPAEFGREAAQLNVSTKPGTNQYHGSAWEFLRNDLLDARAYDFASAQHDPTNSEPGRKPYRQNQYGFTLGGPVRIPKLFNGKNRLFFMTNFEEFNSRTTTSTLGTVLTAAMRGGDFSQVPTALANPNSRTGTYPNVLASPFPGNQIPTSMLSADSIILENKWMPLPNQANGVGQVLPYRNYQFDVKIPVNKYDFTQRIDLNESSNSQWFGRYSWNNESTISTAPTLGLDDGEVLQTRAAQWELSNVRTISATKVNEARFGYNSLFNNITQQLAGKENVDTELNMPVKVTDPNSYGIPNIDFAANNLTSFGNPTSSPFQINDKYYEWVDNFSWVIGKHSLRFGGEYRYNEFPQVGNEFPRGQFYFDSQFTNTMTPGTGVQGGGYTGADFMLGDSYDGIIAVALASAKFTDSEWATYIDDTWRVKPHLTISMGFRWEVEQPLLDTSGNEPNVELNEPLPNEADVPDLTKHPIYVRTGHGSFYDGLNFQYMPYWETPGIGALPAITPPLQTERSDTPNARLINTNYKNFAPRIGIAWSPSDKWSIRVGYGIFYSNESKNSIFDMNRGLGGRTGQTTQTTYGVPTWTYTNFINTATLPAQIPIGLTWGANSHLPTSYSHQWIANVQRTLGKATTVELDYTGSASHDLDHLINQNQGILNASLPTVQRLPYPEWGSSGIQWVNADSNGNYNGLSAKVTQRFGNNLTTLFAYTWSRSLDDTSNIRGSNNNDFSPENSLCPNTCEYGPSDFNVPQRFVTSILYTLPFGKGQHFLNHGGVVNQVVGNWQISTITTMQSGSSVDTSAWDSGQTGFVTVANRLNCVPGVNPVLPGNNQNAWYNSAAFSNPLIATFGNCSRNSLRGPWLGNEDISIIKHFPIHEGHTLEFRMEMFNAPNHVLLAAPGDLGWGGGSGVAPVSTFGTITGTVNPSGTGGMRQIQFALKYLF
jgi:hypothetical protein